MSNKNLRRKNMGNKKKGLIGLGIMCVFSAAVIFGSNAATNWIETREKTVDTQTVNTGLKDGTYSAEEADFDSSGYKGIVNMTVKGGAITELTWDSVDKDGNKKSQLSIDGKYVMTEDGPIWKEQAESLANYVIEQQSVKGLTMNEEGKTDVVSGVSISISGFVNLVEDCLKQAGGASEPTASLKDGTYSAEEADFDSSGYKGIVNMTVKGGAITELTWDSVDKDGNKKSQLSIDGKYVMTEDGPIWKEQAESLANYVIEQQSVKGLTMNEEGKTDVVSGVSISISGFVNLVEDCLKQAGENKEKETVNVANLTDGSYHVEEAAFDEMGYKGIMNMTIKDGVITELSWDSVDKDGNKKSQLSMDGKYVMTEDGPTWKEQAESLANYVIEHQSLEGLTMNEEGKTDVVSGVSISISQFIDFAEECFEQASQTEQKEEVRSFRDGDYIAEASEYDANGYKSIINLTIQDGKITELNWDSVDKEGNKKSQLSIDGKYVMTEDGLIWKEQAEALANYVVEHQSLKGLTTNEEGKTDAVSGVSISISEFIDLVEKCLSSATMNYRNGTYKAEESDFDAMGYKGIMEITIKNGNITELTWDSVDKDGNKKSQLSMDGKYVMTEDGPTWKEQAEALADYVISHQSLEELSVNEEGKTDVVASVSIAVDGFIKLAQECLAQAK